MVDVLIVGGGPAGLSAGLFTAKNGLETVAFDTDDTWMHAAHLFNYLGIRSISGDEFLEVARGQVADRGADIRYDEEVTGVTQTDGGFTVTTTDDEYDADYVVLATGADRDLADDIGCAFTDEETVAVDVTMETSVEDVYATGAMVRAEEWQAIISAGDGAAAALNILSKKKGDHFHDFDTPDDVPDI
jgi:thioredoxin reductase